MVGGGTSIMEYPITSPYYDLWNITAGHAYSMKPVIDLGCGDGMFANVCKEYGVRYHCGVDISPEAIEIAKSRNLGLDFYQEDALHFIRKVLRRGSEYSYVLLNVLQHMDSHYALFKNLPKNVEFIVTVPRKNVPGCKRFFKNVDAFEGIYKRSIKIVDSFKINAEKDKLLWVRGVVR